MDKFFQISFSLILLVVILLGCSNEDSPQELGKDKYKEYDKVMEEFFIAKITGDYDTLKKYLPESIIEEFDLDKPQGTIDHPEYQEVLGEKYELTGFTLYHKSNDQVIYLVDYYDPKIDNPHTYGIYGVKKKDGKYVVMNYFDLKIDGLHFKEETGRSYLSVTTLKELMKKYPEHTYTAHSYKE